MNNDPFQLLPTCSLEDDFLRLFKSSLLHRIQREREKDNKETKLNSNLRDCTFIIEHVRQAFATQTKPILKLF